MVSRRAELYRLSRDSETRIKKAKGMTDSLSPEWEKVVNDCEKSVYSAAERGEYKYFLDASDQNMRTTEKIASALKELLDDVIVIVSPRGIEINWETPE